MCFNVFFSRKKSRVCLEKKKSHVIFYARKLCLCRVVNLGGVYFLNLEFKRPVSMLSNYDNPVYRIIGIFKFKFFELRAIYNNSSQHSNYFHGWKRPNNCCWIWSLSRDVYKKKPVTTRSAVVHAFSAHLSNDILFNCMRGQRNLVLHPKNYNL